MSLILSKEVVSVGMVILSTSFMLGYFSGCSKKADVAAAPQVVSVVTNRMNDESYRKTLQQYRLEQTVQANKLSQAQGVLQACEQRLREKLTQPVTDAAFKEVCQKDPEWQRLNRDIKNLDDDLQKSAIKTRETIRMRMEAEANAQKAVAEGKAVAQDRPVTSK